MYQLKVKFLWYYRDSDSTICVFTFILVFYFSTAGVVWFVILTYAWYICFQSLGTTRDILGNKAVYFHIIAWTQPLILTSIIIALAQVIIEFLFQRLVRLLITRNDSYYRLTVIPWVAYVSLVIGIFILESILSWFPSA